MDIDILELAGVDYHEGVARFAGKAELYEKYLFLFPEDATFGELETAMKDKDYEKAFRLAHALKGVVGNLSLNRFSESLKLFVNMLRDGADLTAAVETMPQLKSEYDRLCRAVNDAK